MKMPLEASLLPCMVLQAHFAHYIKWGACSKARDMHGLRPNSDFDKKIHNSCCVNKKNCPVLLLQKILQYL